MTTRKLIIVEDDPEIRALLAEFLGAEDYEVRVADNGAAFDRLVAAGMPDLVVLDIMLPGEDGFSICRRLRGHSRVPVLMLTAKRDDIDRIVGLELGADDYLVKPFNPRELLARIRAILRRTGGDRDVGDNPRRIRRFEDINVDLDARCVTDADGRIIDLTTAEFDLLANLLERPQRVLSREQLLDLTRGRTHMDPFDRTIDVTVSRLRAKLQPHLGDGVNVITTVRNAGYLFSASVTKG
ncbi:response regulator transcription factor [Martelella alba]|uniref:Response regulator transcription factor n=1 Tax=Martelella alba TaxID=2590451 RepID=A0A506U4U4_9HYPH|nr:response regulator transcription factor [Martelella alba]TPW29392.1 response regulator transcription factor [Martelella alba]